jgi:hypothetical protein
MAAGSIIVDLLLRTGSFSTDTDRAAKDLAKLKKEAYDTGVKIGDSFKSIAGALGLTLGVAGFVAMVKGAIDAADHLNDLSKKTGIAVETLGGIGFAAGQAGGDLESVTQAAGKLNKSLAEAAAGNELAGQAFKLLGINVKDALGNTKSADTALVELADKFAQFEDGPEKAALALRIFGKAGADIIPLLDDGGAALQENIEYFKRYSGVTTETAQAADQFNDTLGKINLISGAFANTLAADLLPALQFIADEFLKVKENGTVFHGVAQGLIVVFQTLAVVGSDTAFVIQQVGGAIGALVAAQAQLLTGGPQGVINIFKEYNAQADEARKKLDAFQARVMALGQPQPEAFESGFTETKPKKAKAPRLPDTGSASKAEEELKKRLEGQIKLIQEFARQQSDAYQFANKFVDEAYAQGLTSLQDNIDAQKRLRDAGLAAQVAALDEEIKARKAALPKLTGTNRIDEENKIKEAVEKRATAVQKASQEDILAAQKSVASLKQIKDGYNDLRAKVLELSGDTAGAAAIRNDKAIEDARKLITEAGGDPKLGDQYADLLGKTTQLSKVQRDYNLLLEDARNTEDRILLDAQANGDSELDTLKKVGAARAKSLEQLGALADKAAELAKTLGTPEAVQFADQLANAFKKASLEVDPLLSKLRDAAHEAGQSIAGAFEDAVIEGRSLRETLQGLAKDLGRLVFRKLITEPMAKSITDALSGTGQSGGILGNLLGIGKNSGTTTKAATSTAAGAAAEAKILTTGDFTRTDHDTTPVGLPAGAGTPTASLDQATTAAAASFTALQVDGIEPTITALQRFQEALGKTASAPGPVDSGETPPAPAISGLTADAFTGADQGTTAFSGEQSIADLFKDADSAQADAARSTTKLSTTTDAAAADILRLAQAAGQGGNALGLLPGIIQLIQAMTAASGASSAGGAGGGGGGLLGWLGGLFGGGSGGAAAGASAAGTGLEGMSAESLAFFFHDGGVVGKDLPKAPGARKTAAGMEVLPALRPNERRALLSVGDEVITRDDPRNVANEGLQLIKAFDGKASDLKGLVVGGDTPQATAARMANGIQAPGLTAGGPLKPNERRAVLEVGEEVLPKDDPRHRDNAGVAMLAEKRFHDGGVVGRAVSGVYSKGAPPAAWDRSAQRDDRAAMRPIQINQTFPPGTNRATTDQAAASAGAAVRKANSRIR